MTTPPERLEWLALSPPPTPTSKTDAAEKVCPHCRWPVTLKMTTCPRCQQSLSETETHPTTLTEMDIDLLPHLITVEDPPDGWFERTPSDSPALYALRLQAEQMQVSTGFDHLICLDDIDIDHYEHQEETALRALRDLGGHVLLADEVGLGKTIEAGIVMKELLERGLVNNILIIVPAPLTWQWHEEMETKFRETFTVLEETKQLPRPSPGTGKNPTLPAQTRWIISLSRAKHSRWAKKLLAYEYDLLIIDEAHKLRNHRTQMYKFVNQIRKRYVLMLTATPVHNHLLELYNLITILRPGHLGTREAFKRSFIDTGPKKKRRSARRTIYHTTYQFEQYLKMSAARRTKYRNSMEGNWLKKVEYTLSMSDFEQHYRPHLSKKGQQKFDDVQQLLEEGYEVFDLEALKRKKLLPNQYDIEFVFRLKLSADAPSKDTGNVPKKQLTPRNPAALRLLLRETMIRNRRTTVGVRFPPREAAVYHLNLTPPERALYDKVTAFIREKLHQPDPDPKTTTANTTAKGRGALHLMLMSLQKQLCSSPQAVARALQKLATRYNDPRLEDYVTIAKNIKQPRKVTATLDIIKQYPDKFLIFTDYLPTMKILEKALREAGYKTLLFHGGLSSQKRVETVRDFRGEAQILISTHSGGEGHNLQFCHQMINYDLP